MHVYTIGFTKTSAEHFFERLKRSSAKRIVDVRLHNTSHLAGFSKHRALPYFAREICGMDYVHLPILAPTKAILDGYREREDAKSWAVYEQRFLALMEERNIEEVVSPDVIADGCLLCREDTPECCHRRLVLEYLDSKWGGVEVEHL